MSRPAGASREAVAKAIAAELFINTAFQRSLLKSSGALLEQYAVSLYMPSTETIVESTDSASPREVEKLPSAGRGGGVKNILSNTASLLTSDVFNRATTFVIYTFVARYLGAHEFGQLSVALTLFYTFRVLAGGGLKMLIAREVAKDKEGTGQYLTNACIVVTFFSAVSLVAMTVFVWAMHYSPDTSRVILLLSLGLLPFSWTAVFEGIFQAWERMLFIAYANVPANLAKVAIAFLLLADGQSLQAVVISLVITQMAIAVFEGWLVLHYIAKPKRTFNWDFARHLTRATFTFLGIEGAIAVWTSVTIVLLSKLATEQEVGLFSAALQLVVPVKLVIDSLSMSVYPIMCRQFDTSLAGVKRISQQLIEVLVSLSLPSAVGLFLLAGPVLSLLYGDKNFGSSTLILQIVVWRLVLGALSNGLGYVLLSTLREKVTLRIVIINALADFGLGLLFISQWGLIGAAASSMVTATLNLVQHLVPVCRLLPNLSLLKLVWKPAAACVVMAGFLVMARDHNLFVVIPLGAAVYGVSLLALEMWASGGPRQLTTKYRYLRSI